MIRKLVLLVLLLVFTPIMESSVVSAGENANTDWFIVETKSQTVYFVRVSMLRSTIARLIAED